MAPHSSALAWRIPWMGDPGRLQSMGSLEVGHGWATSLSLFTFMHWRRKWQPTPVFVPGESQGRGAWWAAVYGVEQSRTRLKRLSSSSMEVYYVYVYVRMHICVLSCFSRVRFFVTLWTVALQDPLSMGFSRQEYWSGLLFPSPCLVSAWFSFLFQTAASV